MSDEPGSYAIAHLAAAAEKARLGLREQAQRRCKLAMEVEGAVPRGEAHRAIVEMMKTDKEVASHIQLAYEALGMDRSEASEEVRSSLEAEGQRYDDETVEDIFQQLGRQQAIHQLLTGLSDDYDSS